MILGATGGETGSKKESETTTANVLLEGGTRRTGSYNWKFLFDSATADTTTTFPVSLPRSADAEDFKNPYQLHLWFRLSALPLATVDIGGFHHTTTPSKRTFGQW